jgi:hypothetical protein
MPDGIVEMASSPLTDRRGYLVKRTNGSSNFQDVELLAEIFDPLA